MNRLAKAWREVVRPERPTVEAPMHACVRNGIVCPITWLEAS